MKINAFRSPNPGLVRVAVTSALACGALLLAPVAADAAALYLKPTKASNGYKIAIGANKRSADFTFLKKTGSSAYSPVKHKFTGKRVKFKVKGFGTVNLKYKKVGKAKKIAVPKQCTGKPGKQRPVVASGKVKVRGEGGYAKANIKKKRVLKGFLYTPPRIDNCEGSGEGIPERAVLNIYGSPVEGGDPSNWHVVEFYAERNLAAGSKARFYSSSIENHGDRYYVFRTAEVGNRPVSTFQFDDPYTGATIAPGAKPFKGSATTTNDFLSSPAGDLKVSYPGLKNVSLTGPDYTSLFYVTMPILGLKSRADGPVADLVDRQREVAQLAD